MEMQIDSKRIRSERENRAWSQEHLAKLTGLGLRTVQRIESTGLASYESVSAIAAVLEISVGDLRAVRPVTMPAVARKSRTQFIPYIAIAAGIIAATAIAKHTSDLGWLVMAGPLLLALLTVGADVLAFRLRGAKRGPSARTLLLMMAFVAACGILALGDPTQVATMIPILGAGAALTIPGRSRDKRHACRMLNG